MDSNPEKEESMPSQKTYRVLKLLLHWAFFLEKIIV